MYGGDQAHGHAEVPPVVEQGQEARVEAAERADRQHHVQQQDRREAERPQQQGLDGGVGLQRGGAPITSTSMPTTPAASTRSYRRF